MSIPSELPAVAALRNFQGKLWAIQYPTKRWGFVGSVPLALSYTALDGSPLDADTGLLIKQHGAGLFRKQAKGVAFETREDAVSAAEALGLTVEVSSEG